MKHRRALVATSGTAVVLLLYVIAVFSSLMSCCTVLGIKDDEQPTSTARELQPVSTDFLDSNSAATIQAMEKHFFSPQVQSSIQRIFNSRVEYDGNVFHYGSLKYTVKGFWRNWKRMMIDGIPTGSSTLGSGINSRGKFVIFAGDNINRDVVITHHEPS